MIIVLPEKEISLGYLGSAGRDVDGKLFSADGVLFLVEEYPAFGHCFACFVVQHDVVGLEQHPFLFDLHVADRGIDVVCAVIIEFVRIHLDRHLLRFLRAGMAGEAGQDAGAQQNRILCTSSQTS